MRRFVEEEIGLGAIYTGKEIAESMPQLERGAQDGEGVVRELRRRPVGWYGGVGGVESEVAIVVKKGAGKRPLGGKSCKFLHFEVGPGCKEMKGKVGKVVKEKIGKKVVEMGRFVRKLSKGLIEMQ